MRVNCAVGFVAAVFAIAVCSSISRTAYGAPPISTAENSAVGVPAGLSPSAATDPTPDPEERSDVDWGPYMADLQRRIKRNWLPVPWAMDKRVVLLFQIFRDGSMNTLKLDKSSGIKSVDQRALEAVKAAAPFRPLPSGAPKFIDVQFTFDYFVFVREAIPQDAEDRSSDATQFELSQIALAAMSPDEHGDKALEVAHRVLDWDPSNVRAKERLDKELRLLGVDPDSQEQRLGRAEKLMSRHNWRASMDELHDAWVINTDSDAKTKIVELYGKCTALDLADRWKKSIDGEDTAAKRVSYGKALLRGGKLAAARSEFKKALSMDANCDAAKEGLSQMDNWKH